MLPSISGSTRVCGLFGFPVAHSFSPVMHNAAFAALGLDYVYAAFPVSPEQLPAAVAAVRALDLAGVNVTVPHKENVPSLLDDLTPGARLAGAVNTIVHRDGRLKGHNTDGSGFVRALAEEAGFDPGGKTALILGAGGAARAVAVHLALAGAASVLVANRTVSRAAALAALLNGHTAARADFTGWPENFEPGARPGPSGPGRGFDAAGRSKSPFAPEKSMAGVPAATHDTGGILAGIAGDAPAARLPDAGTVPAVSGVAHDVCVRVAERAAGGGKSLAAPGTSRTAGFSRFVRDADLIVHTTPLGMHTRQDTCPPFPFDLLRPGQVVVDLVYNPPRTVFLTRAAAAGTRVYNGLGMLLYQGALAFELWTGRAAPLDVMRRALPVKL
ncbi:shikimate dehydrogenase family protein [Desulfotomaculum copahuensis]|uniref:shikimate dehydrogenase family protein n=1 Tax=Desulfotomaculum copahuensis TaxID=1838280 RepID=UPI000AF75B2F|nr:shikimate dehydrogenase [Desulfotomaculum copahuensis]